MQRLDGEEGEGEKHRKQHAATADLSSFLRERLLPAMMSSTDAALASLSPFRLAAPGLAARLLVQRGREREKRGEDLELAEADALEALRLVPNHGEALRLLGDAASSASAAAAGSSSEVALEATDRAFLAFRKLHLSFEGVEGQVAAAAAAAAATAAAAAARASRGAEGTRRRTGGEPRSPPPPEFRAAASPSPPDDEGIAAALRELRLLAPREGIPFKVLPSAAAVRAAFLSRASRCHPDKKKKGGSRDSDGEGDGGAEFVRAHGAYRLLMGVVTSSE